MFKKPFRIKSLTSMKGSDRKKLRADIEKNFPVLDSDVCLKIIPNKEEVTTTKIYTNAGDNVFIYSVNKIPLLFELDKQKTLFPTVYLLWQYPDLIHRFTTWPPVFQKLVDGADLMLPGLILREPLTPSTFRHIVKGQVCSVNVVGNRCPVAVGQTLLSGSDFFDSGMKGKGIHPVHLLGDELWAFGDKSYPPVVEDDPIPSEQDNDDDATTSNTDQVEEDTVTETADISDNLMAGAGVEDTSSVAKGRGEDMTDESQETTKEAVACGDNVDLHRDRMDHLEGGECTAINENITATEDLLENCSLQDTVADSEAIGEKTVLTTDEMDELLQFCFLCAIKSSVKKSDLPIATGTFYKVHVMKYCDKTKNLDVKKSSYKKLSKFLQKQEAAGIVKIKELSKGVDSIVEIDKSHELLRGLEVPEVVVEEPVESTESMYIPPQITEMFAVTASTLPLFKPLGYSKGSALISGDVRQIVTDYVKTNNLQKEESRSDVILDPVLAEMLLVKADGCKESLKWEEVFSRLLNKMSPVYEVVFPGQQPVLRKGNVEPIKIDVVQRASNKKATIVENLDLFGLDAKSFAHTVQVKVACSANVIPSQQKNKGPQVVIQGNQVSFLSELLINTFKIPKKYIKGLEKASKPKRR